MLLALVNLLGGDHDGLAPATAVFGVGLLIAAWLSGREGSSEMSTAASRERSLQARLDAANARISRLDRDNRRLRYQLSRLLGRR